MPVRHIHPWRLFKEGLTGFIEDNALSRGAAIAFYAVIAIAPALYIATMVAALGLGRDAASGAVLYQLQRLMSPESAHLVQMAILHVRGGHHTLWGSLIGVIALIVTASGVFTEIEDALNAIWKAPRTESYLYQLVRGRILSLGLVIALGFLLMISMVLAAGIGMVGHYLNTHTPLSRVMSGLINTGLSLFLVSLLFAAIYKVLPNKKLYWRDVMVGAIGTALLFEMGRRLIALYLTGFLSANIYGAAGGVIVMLVWVYYSAQVFLLGAEFTKVWARHYGSQKQAVSAPQPAGRSVRAE